MCGNIKLFPRGFFVAFVLFVVPSFSPHIPERA